ncbi:unnamed protein product [Rhizoctonia solani]|uniref:Uncharacterized protein n=1 Tax=Rhizoctonia solani TaxID=456999 RepID=A0A8H2XX57_9AGAM|nr:unnamed protein product [Rhizoctonia solani]
MLSVTGRSRAQNHKFVNDVHQNSQNRNALSGGGLELVATGGFDYPDKSDVGALSEIAEDVLRRKSANQLITGVIIIHLTEDNINSGALQRNLRGLVNLFLGKNHLARLTILVVRADSNGPDQKYIVQDMHSLQARAFNEFISGGATVAALKRDAIKYLRPYFSQDIISPPIYHLDLVQQPVGTHVEDALGYYLKESVDTWTERYKKDAEQINQLLNQHRVDQLQLQAKQRSMEEEIAHCRAECARITQLHTNQLQADELRIDVHGPEARVFRLSQDLQQDEAEHAPARSQIQLHDSYEQGEAFRDLESLNNMIECLGRSVCEYLVDTCVEEAFRKDTDDVTTLDAHDLPTLKSIFGHYEGRPSLIASADGSGIHIGDFICFSTRAQICHSLVETIFQPFHPFIDPVESSAYTTTYEQIRRQEPQHTAGKWRSVTFNNIHHPTLHEPVADQINTLTEDILMNIFEPLIKYLFGWPIEQFRAQEQHYVELMELITTAWEWSSKVKREIIMLGDFQPNAVDVHKGPVPFDSRTMENLELNARTRPRFALCVLGLGLSFWQARGGEPPVEVLVHKMGVLTDTYYDDT